MASSQPQTQSPADLVGAHVRMRQCLRLRLLPPCLAGTRVPVVDFGHLRFFTISCSPMIFLIIISLEMISSGTPKNSLKSLNFYNQLLAFCSKCVIST